MVIKVSRVGVSRNGRHPTFNEGGDMVHLIGVLPIRKIASNIVSLSSYYGKLFVERSELKAHDYFEWISGQLQKKAIEGSLRLDPINVFDSELNLTRYYSGMAIRYRSIVSNSYTLWFDYHTRHSFLEENNIVFRKEDEKEGVFVGFNQRKEPLLMDSDGHISSVTLEGEVQYLGDLGVVLDINLNNAPDDLVVVKVMGKKIPLSMVLSYYLGITGLIKLTGHKPTIYQPNQRVTSNELLLTFSDVKLGFPKTSKNILMLSGFTYMTKATKQFKYEDFDNKSVYFNMLDSLTLGVRYLRELDLLQNLFVDPITKQVLELMNEPTGFRELLVRAIELLLSDQHPFSNDPKYMMVRGYERIAGMIYKELVTSVRAYQGRTATRRLKIEMNPFSIWKRITTDNTVKIPEEINPIQDLKDREAVTFVGEGGRNKDAMAKPSRAYHRNDIGLISEATVDSGDVGVNTYLSASPKIDNVRGLSTSVEGDNITNPTEVFSTSAMLSPGVHHDAPTRVNYINIQQSHTVGLENYHQPVVRTGYESVIPHRVGKLFAVMARLDGTVLAKDDYGVLVEYANKTKEGVKLGRQYGRAEGSYYPHDIITPLNIGDKVKKGDVIAYNKTFFEPDMFNPKQICIRNSLYVRTAMIEARGTHEDSSVISKGLSERMKVKTVKVKSFVVQFGQSIQKMVLPKTEVKPETVLFYLQDELVTGNQIFNEANLDELKRVSGLAPKAKYFGTLDKIEVMYHGDKSDMSASLKKIADLSDKELSNTCKALGEPIITGQVDQEYRIAGESLPIDHAEIKLYLIVTNDQSVADKQVIANQMKSVVGETMDYPVLTEDGKPIDQFFSMTSFTKRIVDSPLYIGTTATLLFYVSDLLTQDI